MNINDVFTVRGHMGEGIYVARPELERKLARALKGSQNVLLHGESGNGKTWLYTKVLEDLSANYCVINCASAKNKGSLLAEVISRLDENGEILESYTEDKSATLNVVAAKSDLKHSKKFTVSHDRLKEAYEAFYSRSFYNFIVIDNLEHILEKKCLLKELINLIMLIDDPHFQKFKTKLLIVGVPSNTMDFFEQSENRTTIGNRLSEVPKVAGLDVNQVENLVHRGFKKLKVKLDANGLASIKNHVFSVTLGIPQRAQEYCEKLAYEMEDENWNITNLKSLFKKADESWMLDGLRESYTVISFHMNSKNIKVARKNQIIFCLGKISSHEFDLKRIERLMEKTFSLNQVKQLGISTILNSFCKSKHPILRKTGISKYEVLDPKSIMCLRCMLYLDQMTTVKKRVFQLN